MSDVTTEFYGDTVECKNEISGKRFIGPKSEFAKIRRIAGSDPAKSREPTTLNYQQQTLTVREQIAENQRLAGLRIPTHAKSPEQLNEPPRPRLTRRQAELLSEGNIKAQRIKEIEAWENYHAQKAAEAEKIRDREALAESIADRLAAKQSQRDLSVEIDDATFALNQKWRADDAAIAKAKAEYETIRNDPTKSRQEIAASYQRIWDLEKASLTGAAAPIATETPAAETATAEGGAE